MDNEPLEVHIRAAEPGDIDALTAITARPQVHANLLQDPYQARRAWEERFESPMPGIHSLVACLDSPDGKVVGQIALMCSQRARTSHVASLGMMVDPDHHGRGVGTRLMDAVLDLADNWLQITRVELEVFTDNEPGLALYRRAGFEPEGVKRKAAFRDGVYVDEIFMARLHPRLADT